MTKPNQIKCIFVVAGVIATLVSWNVVYSWIKVEQALQERETRAVELRTSGAENSN